MATLKNTTVNDTGFFNLPSGTTAQRPGSPTAGFGYVNSRTNAGGSSPSGSINNSSKVEIWVR